MKLTLYTNPASRGRTVEWLLNELDVSYEKIAVEFGPNMKTPEYLAINPMGKVPAIVHGETIVTETPAICAYLADLYPEKKLAPTLNDPRRGSYLRWMFFAAGPLDSCISFEKTGVQLEKSQRGFLGFGSKELVLKNIETVLENHPYIAGNEFTAADICISSQLLFAFRMGLFPESDIFKQYLSLLFGRPAFKKSF